MGLLIINLYFQISGLIFILFFSVIYYSRKRLITTENKIYPILLLTSLISILISSISILTIFSLGVNSTLSLILSNLYLASILVWLFTLTGYIYVLSFKKKERLSKSFNELLNKIRNYLVIGCLLGIIVIFALPISIIKEGNIIYFDGISFYFLQVVITLLALLWIVRYITRVKLIRATKSNIILFLFFIILLITTIQTLYNQFPIIIFMLYFVTVVLYFTLDNRDLDLIENLEYAKKQVQEAETSKVDSLLKASHEIRTPLNTIVGFSQSILEESSLENIKEDVTYIKNASKQLLGVVNNILDVYNPEQEGVKFVYNEYNFEMLLKQIVSIAKLNIADQIEFKTDFSDKLPPVLYGDSMAVKKIILNILNHSFKHTKEGYVEFKVDGVTTGNIYRLVITIKDTGAGISEDKLDKLFDPRKIDHTKIKEGELDLNLATTKKLIGLMNGKMSVESEFGEGTTFKISLDHKLPDMKENKEIEVEQTEQVDISGNKILVVDDDKINIKVVTKLLKDYDLTIDGVTSGRECLDKINNNEKYDLILLDDWMPKMSGTETLKELDKIKDFNTPVIALTANAGYGMKEKYLKEGFNDYLPKPVEKKELIKVIEKYLK